MVLVSDRVVEWSNVVVAFAVTFFAIFFARERDHDVHLVTRSTSSGDEFFIEDRLFYKSLSAEDEDN